MRVPLQCGSVPPSSVHGTTPSDPNPGVTGPTPNTSFRRQPQIGEDFHIIYTLKSQKLSDNIGIRNDISKIDVMGLYIHGYD